MFERLGRLVVRHPWMTIVAWIIVAVAVVSLSPKLSTTTDESSFLPKHYESIQAANLASHAFPQQQNVGAVMVFSRDDGGQLTASDSRQVRQISAELMAKRIPKIDAIVAGPKPSTNRLVQLAVVTMPKVKSPTDTSLPNAVKVLRQDAKPLLSGTDLKMGVTGTEAQALDEEQSGNNAAKVTGLATIGIILILLLLIFRSPIIALLPVVLIGVVSQIADGLISDASKAFGLQADSSITPLLIVVLFGVGTDYILFLMFRYRERLRRGEDAKTAMITAVGRVGEAIASAAGAVIIAFLALTLSSLGMLRSMGPALAIAVAVTLLAGLTLVPAVVSLLGAKVFWPSKSWRAEPTGTRFARIGRGVGKRPALVACVSGLVMAGLACGAFGYKADYDLASTAIPKTKESMVALQTMEKGFPAGATDPTDVYLTSINNQPLTMAELTGYARKLAAVPGVGAVTPPKLSPDHRTADYQLTLNSDPESSAAMATVRGPLRHHAHQEAPPGTNALVGGTTAVYVDINNAVDHDFGLVFPVAAVLIMLILGLLLRSVVAPWYLMLSVGLGFAATLGASVLVFQSLANQPGLLFILPVIMYMFVVALGTDYNILMIARLREEAKEGRDPRQATAMALRHAGPTITAAGVILAGTFASLMLAGNLTQSEMGFAVSFGIVVAAFVMAMFFTPSLTALIGHAAWWPGHADRARGVTQRGDELTVAGDAGGSGHMS